MITPENIEQLKAALLDAKPGDEFQFTIGVALNRNEWKGWLEKWEETTGVTFDKENCDLVNSFHGKSDTLQFTVTAAAEAQEETQEE